MRPRARLSSLMLFVASACGGSVATSSSQDASQDAGSDAGAASDATAPPPDATAAAPDFAFSCTLEPAAGACAGATCVVTSLRGFAGELIFRTATDIPGLRVLGLDPLVLGAAGASFAFGISADPRLGATGGLRIVAEGGATTHDVALTLAMGTLRVPTPAAGEMVISGCAGGFLAAPPRPPYREIFVGAWRGGYRGTLCTQVLSAKDGSYAVTVPASCFSRGEEIYLTSGGEDGCMRPFVPGAVERIDLVVGQCR